MIILIFLHKTSSTRRRSQLVLKLRPFNPRGHSRIALLEPGNLHEKKRMNLQVNSHIKGIRRTKKKRKRTKISVLDNDLPKFMMMNYQCQTKDSKTIYPKTLHLTLLQPKMALQYQRWWTMQLRLLTVV